MPRLIVHQLQHDEAKLANIQHFATSTASATTPALAAAIKPALSAAPHAMPAAMTMTMTALAAERPLPNMFDVHIERPSLVLQEYL